MISSFAYKFSIRDKVRVVNRVKPVFCEKKDCILENSTLLIQSRMTGKVHSTEPQAEGASIASLQMFQEEWNNSEGSDFWIPYLGQRICDQYLVNGQA